MKIKQQHALTAQAEVEHVAANTHMGIHTSISPRLREWSTCVSQTWRPHFACSTSILPPAHRVLLLENVQRLSRDDTGSREGVSKLPALRVPHGSLQDDTLDLGKLRPSSQPSLPCRMPFSPILSSPKRTVSCDNNLLGTRQR